MRQLATHSGLFGKVRIMERICDGARYYVTGGSIQTLVDAEGTSLFGYVNACKILLRPHRKVIMLGGGGGSLATMLVRKGHSVTVVDIDPLAEELARKYFNLDKRVRWLTGDARTFLFRNRARYDAIMVDACTSKGTVEHFTNPYWLARAMTSLREDGVLLLNLAHEETILGHGQRICEALVRVGFHTSLLQPDDGWEGNEILVLSRKPVSASFAKTDIVSRPAEARTYLMSLRSLPMAPPADRARPSPAR